MKEWYSKRFKQNVRLSKHAISRMDNRVIDQDTVAVIIESGKIKHKNDDHIWIYKSLPKRKDNLICIAAVIEDKLFVKTVMHEWKLKSE